jgi:hypothetical protein
MVYLPAGGDPMRSAIQFWKVGTDRSIDQLARLDDDPPAPPGTAAGSGPTISPRRQAADGSR